MRRLYDLKGSILKREIFAHDENGKKIQATDKYGHACSKKKEIE